MVREREVSKAAVVSLIVDEVTDISVKAQVSITVMRYVPKNVDAEEQLLRACSRSERKCFLSAGNASSVQQAKQVLCHFNCASKFVAPTSDGAAVIAGEHAKRRERCKDAIFVNCYAHKLNLVLSQSANFIKPVKIFFTSLSGFGTFFSKSAKKTEALGSEVKTKLPSSCSSKV